MGESRNELLAWVNNLLQLNITKIEQFGTGAALCQIYDSIFQDVGMAKVKFNVNSEYMYLQNFKVLQSTFTKHGIDRTIPVEQLVKCKMQDNLEFLQWTKRFWDQYFPGGEYDAMARRKASGAPATASTPASSRPAGAAVAGVKRAAPTMLGARAGVKAGTGAGSAALINENNQLKEMVQGLEREKLFYFSKLRDIELLVQQAMETHPELEANDESLEKQIQDILYSTEEGFEIPADADGEGVADDGETF